MTILYVALAIVVVLAVAVIMLELLDLGDQARRREPKP